MEKRVLFVMEDPSELSSLQTMLAPLSGEWELSFVAKAEEALAVLDQPPVDVILSGIHLTGMGGLELLAEVKRRAPPCGSDRLFRLCASRHDRVGAGGGAPVYSGALYRRRLESDYRAGQCAGSTVGR